MLLKGPCLNDFKVNHSSKSKAIVPFFYCFSGPGRGRRPNTNKSSDSDSDSVEEEEPHVKDPFWDDLEAGKIDVFANDLYSKVKERRKASAAGRLSKA